MPQRKKRITIASVAKHAQVSMMTVSRVVNDRGQVSDAMKQRVLSAMNELGYKPNRIARSLVSNKTFKIGVIVPDMSSMFFASVLASIEHILWEHDYYMVLCNTGKDKRREQDILDVFEEDQVDGVIIFGTHLNKDQLTNLLKNQRAAVVFNSEVDPNVAGQILMNQSEAIAMAVKHLINVGRTNLGYIDLDQRTYSMRERRQAFEDTTTQLSVNSWVLDSGKENLEPLIKQYLQKYPQTDGIICFNDEMAVRALVILKDEGKQIPEDIAIIGYDDVKIAVWVTPKLTTIRLKMSISKLGELAAQMLLDRIEGKGSNEPIILDQELIIRDSTPSL
jgi:LacI family transcriptional regulator